jgi:monofunctional biosynthetic peptidoglycan transglycosylase
LAGEDDRFYRHQGFAADQLKRALVENLKSGRFGRGASTISQQLVKNVFLDHQRTLSRKLQEALLTWRMEQVVSKDRILEVYLNMVELGDGIHGVEAASRRYFGVGANRLSPLQAAHLAALTPSPRPLALRFRSSGTDEHWRGRLSALLRSMRRSGKLSHADQLKWASVRLILLPY